MELLTYVIVLWKIDFVGEFRMNWRVEYEWNI